MKYGKGLSTMKDISEQDITNNLRLITKKEKLQNPRVQIGNVVFGEKKLVIIAGPCTIESKTQIFSIAKAIKESGASMLRGGVFKPLTFPYGDPLRKKDADSSSSLNDTKSLFPLEELIKTAERRFCYFKEASEMYEIPIVSEVVHSGTIEMMSKYVDMFQIGYRQMFNMDLIEALSKTSIPIMIKRHYGESLRSLLGVGEHFAARGKENFIFCERGVAAPHTHNVESRAIVDIQAIPALNDYCPTVPVITDPSHATFKRSYVAPVSRAAVAAGADGLIIETHHEPEKAWVDPLQALDFKSFDRLMKELERIALAIGRTI